MISIVESVIKWAGVDSGATSGGAISAFRGVRLLRVFKLARSWKSFQDMLIKIGKTLKDISNCTVLLFLFMFTYTLLGMELYAYNVKFNDDNEVDSNGESPRANFDTFLEAFTTIFIVLIGEDWNQVMYAHIRASGHAVGIIFFVSLVIFGNFILLNLFLAILLKNFEEEEKPEEELEAKKENVFNKLKNALTRRLSQLVRRKPLPGEAQSSEANSKSVIQMQPVTDEQQPVLGAPQTKTRSDASQDFGKKVVFYQQQEGGEERREALTPSGEVERTASFHKSSEQPLLPKGEQRATTLQQENPMDRVEEQPNEEEEVHQPEEKKEQADAQKPEEKQDAKEDEDDWVAASGAKNKFSSAIRESPMTRNIPSKSHGLMLEDETTVQGKEIKLQGRALFLMSKQNPLRRLCRAIVAN